MVSTGTKPGRKTTVSLCTATLLTPPPQDNTRHGPRTDATYGPGGHRLTGNGNDRRKSGLSSRMIERVSPSPGDQGDSYTSVPFSLLLPWLFLTRPSHTKHASFALFSRFKQVRSTKHLNPFRTAVPIWGQTILIPSDLTPKRDWGPKRVNER